MGSRTLWLWLFVGSLGVTAALGMMAILLPSIPLEEEMLATSALLTAYSLLGLMASVTIARGQSALLAWLAVGLLSLSLFVWLLLTWFQRAIGWKWEETVAKSGATLTIFGIVALHAALLLLARFERSISRLVRIGAIAAASIAGVLAVCLVWDLDPIFSEDWTARCAGAMAIPGALGTIAIPVLARIEYVSRREGEEHTIERHVRVRMRCPRCGHEGQQPANRRSHCPGCGLETTITMAEPRCVCGYLLHGLPEPICPECGRPVTRDRWWQNGGASSADGPAPTRAV